MSTKQLVETMRTCNACNMIPFQQAVLINVCLLSLVVHEARYILPARDFDDISLLAPSRVRGPSLELSLLPVTLKRTRRAESDVLQRSASVVAGLAKVLRKFSLRSILLGIIYGNIGFYRDDGKENGKYYSEL